MPKRTVRPRAAPSGRSAAPRSRTPDWRAETLDRVRRLIREADPEIVEEQKWKKPSNPAGIPVWSRHGIICTGETYVSHLRFTFASGAALPDPRGVFNSGLGGNAVRALVLREGEWIDEAAFRSLVRAAVALNASSARR